MAQQQQELQSLQAEMARRQELNSLRAEMDRRSGAQSANSPREQSMSFGQALSESGNKIAEAMKTGLRRSAVGIGDVIPSLAGMGLNAIAPGAGNTANIAANKITQPQLDYFLGSKEQNIAKDKAFSELAQGNPILHGIALGTELAPTAFIGGGSAKAAQAPKFIREAFKNRKLLGEMVGLGAKNAAIGAGSGATMYDPNASVGEKALTGGVTGGIAGGALGLGRLLRPSTYLGKNIKPEELERVQEALGDLPTGLGRVVNSPALTRLQENALARIPGTGVNAKYGQIGNALDKEGEDILGKLGQGFAGTDVQNTLRSALNESKGAIRTQKNTNYNAVNTMADEAGIKIVPENYQSKARELLKGSSTKDFQELEDTSLSSLLKKASGKKGIQEENKIILPVRLKQELDDTFKSKGGQTFENIGIVRGLLNKEMNAAYKAGDDYKEGVFRELKSALDKDMAHAIESSKSPAVREKFSEAQKFYGEKYAPFKEPEIRKFTDRNADSDLLTNFFVRTGKNDRGNLAEKLISKLPEDKQSLLAFDYLSKAKQKNEGTGALTFNATKLGNLWSHLGEKTQASLVKDPALRRQLDNYVIKMTRNREALNRMNNPQTGQRALEMILPAALGGAAGSVYGGKEGGLTGLLGTLGATSLGGRLINRSLTSPKTRKKVIDQILGKEKVSLKKNVLTAAGIGGLGRAGREEEQ